VLVVGAGPVGLAVADSLLSHRHDVAVVDRQAAGANTSRAAVVHARTLEMLEQIGVSDQLTELGIQVGPRLLGLLPAFRRGFAEQLSAIGPR